MLRHVLDADFEALLERAKRVTNVTCMQPVDTDEGYELFDDTLLALPLRPGARGGLQMFASRAHSAQPPPS